MAILTVGTGKQFATIAAATAAAKAGDTVQVQAGTYSNDFATINTAITLVAVGGPVTMTSTSTAAPAAALLTVNASATINGFTFTGMRSLSGAGAGILVTAGTVLVENSLFTNNQNGLLATANAATSVTIQSSEFSKNGNNNGVSGNVNAAAIAALTISGSYIHDAVGGDEVKSLAATTTISGTRIQDNSGTALYAVETPNGGVVTLSGNTIEKGANSTVSAAIHFGGGALTSNSSLTLSNNTIVSDKPGALVLWNQATAAATLNANTTYGFASIASGPVSPSAGIVASTRPATPTTALVTGGLAAPIDYGRAGAVIATGHILTVGAGKQYATVAAAIAASVSGDTIQVSAGTYVNDTATINDKIIIQGVGGPVRFVDTATPANGLAQFVTTTDATFQNIEIFGATSTISGTAAAAILDQGGNLTIDNSYIHNNQAGIVATPVIGPITGPITGSVGIFDTEISSNTANITIGTIGSLTMQNDLVSNATAGSEITSNANNTTLSGDRILQVAGNTAPVVALPDGGTVAITGTAIEKALSNTAAPIVQIGGGTVASGSVVTLSNDTLISDVTAAPTTFVANTGAASLAVSGTAFAGGAAGSVQVSGGTNTAAATAKGVTVNTAAPDSPSGVPATAPLTVPSTSGNAQPGQLVLYISEAAYRGDAQFTVIVDGVAVGGTLTATASHAAGQTESFTVAGNYAPGAHAVAVKFTNSLGAGANARALYIDGMAFNGQNDGQADTLVANGISLQSTGPVVTPTQVTINLSEDAYQGNAMAFITIDGKVQGGVQTITASHAAGQGNAMSFLVDLAPGAHTIGATILNGIAGTAGTSRDLYVNSVDVGTTHYANAAAAIGAAGSSNFAFTVAAPAAANGSLFITSGFPQPVAGLLPAS
jgi:hypothetical protein